MLQDYEFASCKDAFFKANFNVDQCLATYTQKSDLETLRRDLKQYGTELHTTMSEILKTETEAIVYLAESLTNLSTKIDDISVPISQLREEIRSLYESIKKVQDNFEKHLNSIKTNISESHEIKLKIDMIVASLYVNNLLRLDIEDAKEKLTYLERAVDKYSFQKMYLEGTRSEPLDIDLSETEKCLIERIHVFFLNALREKDAEILTRCLRMYANLNLHCEAEKFYREKVVKPGLQRIFTQRNLERHQQELAKVYKEALDFLNNDMKVILEVIQRNPDLKGFNFVINSFWHEADKELHDNLPNITAPGNPDLFQKRFKETWQFFKQIALKCNNLKLLKSDQTFKEHIKRFNLAVYFEIRFQQLVTKIEEEILTNTYTECGHDAQFHLKVTEQIWKSLERCFNEDVFIDQLADQFLKLSMLILSRYTTWLDSCLQKLRETDDFRESYLLNALIDVALLNGRLGNKSVDINNTVYKIFPKIMHHLLYIVLDMNNKILIEQNKKIRDVIVNLKVQECVEFLAKVDSIPRLYRRTNRSFPKDPSSYVMSATDIITNFHTGYKKFNSSSDFIETLDCILQEITKKYLNHVEEVLKNVCKTEESLRRLKNRNQPSNEDSGQSGNTISDEKKIREQIKLDAGYFRKTLTPFASEASKKELEKLDKGCNFKN